MELSEDDKTTTDEDDIFEVESILDTAVSEVIIQFIQG